MWRLIKTIALKRIYGSRLNFSEKQLNERGMFSSGEIQVPA